MRSSLIATLLSAITASAAPSGLITRQETAPANSSALPDDTTISATVQLDNISWNRNGTALSGISFEVQIKGVDPPTKYPCSSTASGSGEAFAPQKTDRCGDDSPLTFAFSDEAGGRLELWYSDESDGRSYSGESPIVEGNNQSITIQMQSIE